MAISASRFGQGKGARQGDDLQFQLWVLSAEFNGDIGQDIGGNAFGCANPDNAGNCLILTANFRLGMDGAGFHGFGNIDKALPGIGQAVALGTAVKQVDLESCLPGP